MFIKCPKCGSTTQPELIFLDSNSNYTQKKDDYECGCGCRFRVIFKAVEFVLLEEGD